MTKYTAKDFANAKFAELGKHGLRAHKSAGDSYWQRDGIKRATNEEMADAGWIPVPTKPTITESELDELHIAAHEIDGRVAIREAARSLGIEVTPDSEPTNTERLADILVESFNGMEFDLEDSFRAIAAVLDKHGVTAPNVKGN